MPNFHLSNFCKFWERIGQTDGLINSIRTFLWSVIIITIIIKKGLIGLSILYLLSLMKNAQQKKNVTHISPFKSNSNRIDSNEMNGTGWDGIGLEATRAARFIYNEIESA